jgi:hypothetical protein
MTTGDRVLAVVDGQRYRARVVRILDRHGQAVTTVDLDAPEPFTTLVVELYGRSNERLCVPLWLPDPAMKILHAEAA